ncbi:MAG TPA: hypothetical protein VIO16_12825 [Dehalococcoidia bacterium]
MTAQLDMFSAPAPVPIAKPVPAADPARATSVHWILIKTKSANTACGVGMAAYYKQLAVGYSAAGEKLHCTYNRDDGTITCPRCLEEMT